MRRVAICCLLAACGRLNFDDRVDDDGGDAHVIPGLCMPNATAPDPLTISGTTFRYMSFDNSQRTPLASVTVSALDENGTQVAVATSDAMARYTLSIQTGGAAPRLVLAYALIGSFDTRVTIDRPVDRNITGANMAVWTVGDGPVWDQATMNQFYAAAGTTRLATRGTLNIAIRDCADQPIPNVTIDIAPAPELVLYQSDDGMLVSSGSTLGRFATAFALNAVPGPTTITATADGYTFAPLGVMVYQDQANTLAIAHADP